ncbi:hypothetical protein AMTRI_Chr06g198790 [Amborella trichopoda]
MMLNLRIISTESIKPSSPTPESQRTMKLCFMDQMVSTTYIPLIFFYTMKEEEPHSQRLKQSLAHILTSFYPLAGRIQYAQETGEIWVECNDEGVEFKEAQVEGDLSLFLERPPINEIKKLLPCEPLSGGATTLLVQANWFKCGGLALGICMSHMVGDMASVADLMNCWARVSRSSDNKKLSILAPRFDWRSLFSPNPLNLSFEPPSLAIQAPPLTKVFIFQREQVEALRDNGRETSNPRPTSVGAVSALLWRCLIKARCRKTGKDGTWHAVYAVNIRTRMEPQAPDGSFGNLSMGAPIALSMTQSKSCLRMGIQELSCEFLKKVQESPHILEEMIGSITDRASKGYAFGISSYCKFPLYESDFGWGKPDWVSSVGGFITGVAFLFDDPSENGIQAWVNLGEEEMAHFECDPELLAFVSKQM